MAIWNALHKACNFTKSINSSWVLFMFFKWYKCCQVTQSITIFQVVYQAILKYKPGIFLIIHQERLRYTLNNLSIKLSALLKEKITHKWRRWGTSQNFIFPFIDKLWKTWQIRLLKNWKKFWRYHHFTHVYQKTQSYKVKFLRYGVR